MVECLVGFSELRFVGVLDRDAVAAPDLFPVGDPLAGEALGGGGEPVELRGKKVRALPIVKFGGRFAQRRSLVGERTRGDQPFRRDELRKLVRPVVGIDEPVDVAAEA